MRLHFQGLGLYHVEKQRIITLLYRGHGDLPQEPMERALVKILAFTLKIALIIPAIRTLKIIKIEIEHQAED
jgi:hypothetical protein